LEQRSDYDAIVVGAGPNGLAAAIVLAKAGRSVLVLEAQRQVGGGVRSEALTLPGYTHDVCSAVHPMAIASPFLRALPLQEHGLEWIQPPYPLAHPLDDGSAAVLDHSLAVTSASLGSDAIAYERLMGPLFRDWQRLEQCILGPLQLPRHPFTMARFGVHAIQPATRLARSHFKTEPARALFAGLAAHSLMPLEAWGTSAIALVLGILAHVSGWPIPKGGSQRIADAMASYLRSLGGEIVTGMHVWSQKELPASKVVLYDLSPRALLQIAGESLPPGYRHALDRFQYGPAVFKVDWALRAPIPWKSPQCAKAGTVHLGGTLAEIARSERDGTNNAPAERPFVLLAQPSLFDPTRAPAGCHTAWAYCHVPTGCRIDMTSRIEVQVERFAPGFAKLILARSTRSPAQMEDENPNLIGGNISGGANSLRQLLIRPTLRFYSTPAKGIYLCSASTPPGAGVHGMCGYHAATLALKSLDAK
jgi:phytoene dehydrogenase-like protein